MLLNCGAGEDSLRVVWTARRSNQSVLKEINPEYSLEGLMLKLKLQYFGHLMQRADSLEKTLMLGKTEGRRRRGVTEDEMVGLHHWLNGHEFEQTTGDSEAQGSLVCCSSWGHSWTTPSDWARRQRSETEEGRPGWANSVLCETWVPMGPADQGCYPVKEPGNWALYPPTATTSVPAFLAGMCRLRSAFSPKRVAGICRNPSSCREVNVGK